MTMPPDKKPDADESNDSMVGIRHPQALASVRKLAAGVAHEVNNILGVIMGNAHLAAKRVDADHPAYKFIQEIRAASEEGRNLMRELGSLAGERALRQRATDVNQIVTEVIANLDDAIGLDYELGDDLPPIVIDPLSLSETTRELIELAAEDGARVNVSTALQPTDDGSVVSVVIVDDRAPAEDEDLNALFEPFARLPHRPSAGLRVTKAVDLVCRASGSIEIDRAESGGTAIAMSFPVAENESETVSSSERPRQGYVGVYVDEAPVRRLVVNAVSALRLHPVLLARTGEHRPSIALAIVAGTADDIAELPTDNVLWLGAGPPGAERLPIPFTAKELCNKIRTLLSE